MSNKSTPGPWEVNGSGEYEICELDTVTITANHDISDDGPERVMADARLIAAAPDLLAALEELSEYIDGYFDMDQLGNERLASARAAIAKAKGGGA